MNTAFRTFLTVLLGCLLAGEAFAQPPTDLSSAEMLKRADADGDGKVSRDEFIKAQTARLEKAFARMDTDGDGKLSPEEFADGRSRMRDQSQRNGKGPGGRGRLDREGGRVPEEGFRKPPQQD
jgi:hypothetical protein